MPEPSERLTRFNLIGGEDTYASQVAQNPQTARKLTSLIPSFAGYLEREKAHPKFTIASGDTPPAALPLGVGWIYGAYFTDPANGNVHRYYLAATSSNIYLLTSSGGVDSWVVLISTTAAYPQAVMLNNKLLLSDGVSSWIVIPKSDFSILVIASGGLPIPLHAPTQAQTAIGLGSQSITAISRTVYSGTYSSPYGGGSYFYAIVTVTVGVALFTPNVSVTATIAGVTDSSFNGTYVVTPTSTTQAVYYQASGVNASSSGGTCTVGTPSSVSITAITRTNGVTSFTLSGALLPASQTVYMTIASESDTSLNGEWLVTPTDSTHGTFQQPGLPDSSGSSGGSASLSTFSVLSTRYYWTTFVDELGLSSGPSRVHESSSSPRSLGTGVLTNAQIAVKQRAGTIATTAASANIVGTGTDFGQDDVGDYFYTYSGQGTGVLLGKVLSVTDSQHLTLDSNAPATTAQTIFAIAPPRATHWSVYASESESSNIGFLLATVPFTGTGSNGVWVDQQPFQGAAGSVFNGNTSQRPYRSDPPVASLISTVHKRRNFHRRETRPNFFLFSAYEEVLQFGDYCAPEESYPGTSVNTASDIINETSFPDQSREVTNLASHGDGLFIFSEKNAYVLYGESIDDFSLTQTTAFSMGCAGRFAAASTPHGLVFVSYDAKVMLYPTQFVFWAILGNATSSLIELSKSKRIAFERADASSADNIRIEFYQYGRRDWLVYSFKLKAVYGGTWQTWVYDFETQGWFQLSLGVQSLAVLEPTRGYKVLVGGGTDGFVYVLDDVTGTYSSASAQPAGLFRTALCDFGRPDMNHVVKYVEFEVSNPSMVVSVNWYKDPVDVDNPTNPLPFNVQPLRIGAGKYRCWPSDPQGMLCNRALFEFNVVGDTNDGQIRSVSMYAEMAAAVLG